MGTSAGRGRGGTAAVDGAGLAAPARPVAERVLAVLAAVAAEFGAGFVPPAPTPDPVAAVVETVGALARAAARRLGGSCSPWRLAAVVSGGRLLGPDGPDLPSGPGTAGNTSWLCAAEGVSR